MNIKAMMMALSAIGGASLALPAAAAETAVTVDVAVTDAQISSDASYLGRVEPYYLSTAGSQDNLASLTYGLRHAAPVTLSSTNADGTASLLTFTPPTRPMGYGNITHTLDLATRDLAAAGIASPTSEQLHAALMGGTVTNAAGETIQMAGVLQLRSQGMGWGKIAHTLGVSPSPHSRAALVAGGAVTVAKPLHTKTNGITTADGSRLSTASSGKSAKSGVVTANGGGASHAKYSHSNGHAKSGIVSAGGASAGISGVTNAHGNGVQAGGLAGAGARVSTAGGSTGNGNAFGKSKH